ncbi:predicted protein [Nematostella vectensis]|uniref:Uncharacterized protein n=1 Tax=Nematostella vectensis TaxID=45351 RepID=A7RML4_NEMVE|nr:predicted protein [Nematostella vectensis]|eukprot:XP_001639427.1 predicted protein [Nematostella vectensis]
MATPQSYKQKWDSSELQRKRKVVKYDIRHIATTVPQEADPFKKLLVCKRISSEMESRNEFMNKIIQEIVTFEGVEKKIERHDRKERNVGKRKRSFEHLQFLQDEKVKLRLTSRDSKVRPRDSDPTKPCTPPATPVLKPSAEEEPRYSLVGPRGSDPTMLCTPPGTLVKKISSEGEEAFLSLVCLKKIFPNAKLELY